MSIPIDFNTGKEIDFGRCMTTNEYILTGDKGYIMLADNTAVICQAIDKGGEMVNGDGSLGEGIIGPCRIMDQRVFYNNILYCIKYNGKNMYTRASLIKTPYSKRPSDKDSPE